LGGNSFPNCRERLPFFSRPVSRPKAPEFLRVKILILSNMLWQACQSFKKELILHLFLRLISLFCLIIIRN